MKVPKSKGNIKFKCTNKFLSIRRYKLIGFPIPAAPQIERENVMKEKKLPEGRKNARYVRTRRDRYTQKPGLTVQKKERFSLIRLLENLWCVNERSLRSYYPVRPRLENEFSPISFNF